MGRRWAFSARKRIAAIWPEDVEPRVNPQKNEVKVVRRSRRSKGMFRRGAVEGGFEGRDVGAGGLNSEFGGIVGAIVGVEAAIAGCMREWMMV